MGRVAEGDLGVLRVARCGPRRPGQILSAAFPAATLHADLLVQVSAQRLMHVEYMRSASPDLGVRMIGYRSQIMRYHPNMRISQHAIILGSPGGFVRVDPDSGSHLGLRTIYLRDCDPALFWVFQGSRHWPCWPKEIGNPGLVPCSEP